MPAVQELFPEPVAAWATVAVDRPIDVGGGGLTWAIPTELADLQLGERVVVPLGRRGSPTNGWVVGLAAEAPQPLPETWKFVLRRAGGPQLPEDLINLGLWIAHYYLAAPGLTLSGMVPAAVTRGTGTVERRLLHLAPDAKEQTARGPAQRAVLDILRTLPSEALPIERRVLRTRAGIKTFGPIDKLVDNGLLIQECRTEIDDRWSAQALEVPETPIPTAAQQTIIDDVGGVLTSGFSTHLLLGVTGSGKTEVYIRLIEAVLRAGKSVIMLVPEISLTPQTGARLSARFPNEQVAVLHSALPGATRNAHWSAIAQGQARGVLGARSAVFAPMTSDQLGLIIVDEEHDGSYKQDSAPRYHGRDVAIRRAQMAGCPVLLGSATPSLESWQNATVTSKATLHRLPERAPGLEVPTVRVIDMAQQRREGMAYTHAISPPMRTALRRTLEQQKQALLLLNRRGWATWISCRQQRCGWVMRCDQCDATMIYHRRGDLPTSGYLRCHHCQAEVRLPRQCPDCGSGVARLGTGVQRVEDEVLEICPSLVRGKTLCRVDTDSMGSAQDFHDVLGRFQRGEIQVLLGTQMIAKGLDVPTVQLVGVIDADTALNLPDFRASERTCQLISQVTGRCGRGASVGLALVQTLDPTAAPIRAAINGHYEQFADEELQLRQQVALPPIARLARVTVQHPDLDQGQALIGRVTEAIKAIAPPGVTITGPAPCTYPRLRGRHRFETLLSCADAGTLQSWLHACLHAGAFRERFVSVDVDAYALA